MQPLWRNLQACYHCYNARVLNAVIDLIRFCSNYLFEDIMECQMEKTKHKDVDSWLVDGSTPVLWARPHIFLLLILKTKKPEWVSILRHRNSQGRRYERTCRNFV